MKISILLPYKEKFSPIYAGAVSLYVKDTSLRSIFKKSIKDLLPEEICNRSDKIGMAPPPNISISNNKHKL